MKHILNTMLVYMKALFVLSTLPFLLNACSQSNHRSDQEPYRTHQQPTMNKLTSEQQAAFDALNTLQVSTDYMNRIYSTFAGIDQPCYPPDTSLTITQSELLIAMKKFVTKNCKLLSVEQRNELAETAVLAQEEYTLSLCLDNLSLAGFEFGDPFTGTWVMPNVLGRRDVIIVW